MIRDLNRSFDNNQNYSWGNAVADILGAVMQRNQQRGAQKDQANMYGDIANFGNNLNNLDYGGQTTTQDLTPQGSNVRQQTGQGLLPTSFNTQTPTSANIGQGIGLLSGMNQSQQSPTTVQQQTISNPLEKYSQANNPVKTTTSAPKTLQEQTSMIKSQLAPAMKELIGKYPNVNPKELLSMLQQATNDKITEHTSNYQQQQMNDLYQGFVNEENPNRKAMYAARLKNMGYDVTSAYKEFAPDYTDKVVDSGDSQNLLSFDKKSGKYYDGGKLSKSVSPDARLNADTRIQTTGMNNATTLQAAAMRGSRGSGSSRANHYEEGAGTKNGKRLDPVEKQKYNELYQSTLEDIWDSATPEIRAQKIQQHADTLNELGYYMDRDVENDLRAITGG
jgi:hypothetical protein